MKANPMAKSKIKRAPSPFYIPAPVPPETEKDPETLEGWRDEALVCREELKALQFENAALTRELGKTKDRLAEQLKELTTAEERLDELDVPEVANAVQTLKAIEWCGTDVTCPDCKHKAEMHGTCPVCKQHKSGMHAPDCLLGGAV
jgi:rubrerythrin